ncbi:MAG: PASTA domain-containing protein [Balneolales bacterium]|nr:PASTA domain-containing protein [Balneolales bacterium]
MNLDRASLLTRMFVVFLAVLVLPCAIVFQLFRIQFMEGQNLRSLWSAQAIDFIPITAQRGNILDANGRILVTNSTSYSVAVDPLAPGVTQESLAEISRILGHFSERNAVHYSRLINQAPAGSRYIVMGRNFDRAAFDSLRSLRNRALILEENYRRRYNFESLGAHVLGHVNHNLTGMMGLESFYNAQLSGTDGLQQVRRDSRNRVKQFVGAPRKKPIQGHSLVTTIDAQIQAIVEEELRDGVRRVRANRGTAIVVEPSTGRIVALANYPTFNPNSPGSTPEENRRNSAISDMIEPGSTFKIVAAVAALEQGLTNMDEVFVTPENGRRLIHGQWMRDHDPLGTLSFREAFEKSSNVVFSEVAMRLEQDTFYQYVRNFGFGTATSIDLSGEESGRLQQPFNWSRVTQPWMSVGYEVQVTPLQMVMAYAAVANGGNLMRPFIVERVVDERGRTVQQNSPKVIRRAVQSSTIQTLMPALTGVVSEDGTAQFASVPGLSIAGKTGTAQKFIDGRYRTRYRASFVGYFPAEAPKYVTLILFDEPRTSIYGGFTGGPVFRNIARRTMGVDPAIRQFVQGQGELPDQRIAPSLVNLDLAAASRMLQHQAVPFSIEGNGSTVISQIPEAGQSLENGQVMRLFTGSSPLDRPFYAVMLASAAEKLLKEQQQGDEGVEADHVVEKAVEAEPLKVPDVRGLSMRDAVLLLRNSGYEVTRNGSGTVYAQFPQGGSIMQAGRQVTIRGRARPMEQLVGEAGR